MKQVIGKMGIFDLFQQIESGSAGRVHGKLSWIVAGLGNPGLEYEQTRHNAGFLAVEELAKQCGGVKLNQMKFQSNCCEAMLGEVRCLLMQPTTYMNLSGNAVRYWKEKENIAIENILVLVDDIALPFGTIRLKPSGSDAGHNGLKNIADMLGTQNYARLRFGIGNDFPRGCQVDYVLGHFTPEQEDALSARVNIAVEAAQDAILAGLQHAMCNYNNK